MKRFQGRRMPMLLLLLVSGLAAWAGVVVKGGGRRLDVLLSEGFESEAWRIAWTTVDADGSGDSWGRLGTEQYYTPHSGSWALGSRFRADGIANDDWLITPPMRPDSSRRFFKIWYRSQDPAWPETVEFLFLHVEETLPAGGLETRLGDFQLIERVQDAPATWQEFSHELPSSAGGVWYFALRNVSQDRFVLLVDDASGFNALPLDNWMLEPQFRRYDFGLTHVDSLRIQPFRLWNLDAADTLAVQIHHRPRAPFVRGRVLRAGAGPLEWDDDSTLFLYKADPDSLGSQDSLHIDFGARSWYLAENGLDTLSLVGTFQDSLTFDLFHYAEGSIYSVSVPFSVSFWTPDSLARLDLHEDFESGEAAGWLLETGDAATDTLAWSLGDHCSSSSFTVPLLSRFAYVNSDARGRFTADGLPLVQDAWLVSPWLDLSHTRQGEPSLGLLLAWDQVLLAGAGGDFEILADSAGGGWRSVARPEDSENWESRSLDLSALAGTDSLRLAFRYQGNWSYGVALDNIVLLAVADALPGSALPASPPERPRDTVVMAPNPFNPLTTIRWQAAAAGRLEVQVYNLLGQRVMSRGPWLLHPGANTFPLNFSRMASGVYLVRMVCTGADGAAAQELRRVTYLK